MKDYPLLTVCIVASLGMSLVMILGSYYDAAIKYYYPKEVKPVYVECSATIVNMAKKINVTLLDMCVVENN